MMPFYRKPDTAPAFYELYHTAGDVNHIFLPVSVFTVACDEIPESTGINIIFTNKYQTLSV